MKKTFTTFDIAKMLDVYPTTIADWIDEDKLKAFTTPGGHRRVSREDLLEFLQKHNMPIPEEFVKTRVILVVDDDEKVVYVLERLINKKLPDYRVVIAMDGFEAGRAVSAENPDLIILDIALPGIDGFKVCELIRKNNKETAILVITGFPTDENRNRMLDAGADKFMAKPFVMEDLMNNIQELLNR